MQIELSAAEEAEIRRRADAIGYQSAERYLIDLALSQIAVPSNESLKASVERCDRGMADANADLGVPAREALSEIASELGLTDPSGS